VLAPPSTFDEHGRCVDLLEPWPVMDCTSVLAPDRDARFATDRWSHQARRFFGCELIGHPEKRYDAGTPTDDAGILELRREPAAPSARVRIQTFPIARTPATLASAQAAAVSMGGAGFDVLVKRTQRIWQLRLAAEGPRDGVTEELVAAILASVLLGPILARDGKLFGVKTARERLARRMPSSRG